MQKVYCATTLPAIQKIGHALALPDRGFHLRLDVTISITVLTACFGARCIVQITRSIVARLKRHILFFTSWQFIRYISNDKTWQNADLAIVSCLLLLCTEQSYLITNKTKLTCT